MPGRDGRKRKKRKKNMLIRMTHLNHTPPTLYLIHFLIRETEWRRIADLRWWSEAVRERSSVQSLLTAWLPISLQHGTYLSSASHSLEHLTLRFVKKEKKKRKKTAIKLKLNQYWTNQWSRVQTAPLMSNHSPPLSMHCPPTDNHSAHQHKYSTPWP